MANKRKDLPQEGGTAKGNDNFLPTGKSKWIIAAVAVFIIVVVVLAVMTSGG